jgi:hypothetical protein
MTIPTQGTQLYFLDPVGPAVVEVACALSIDGFELTNNQTPTTCLSSLVQTFIAGRATPGTVTFPVNFNPASTSHIRLKQLQAAGTTLSWAVGFSPFGIAAPTIGKPVASVTVGTPGSGYTTTPTVAFSAAPAGGVTATGVAVRSGSNTIIGVTITNPGRGYITAPTVTFSGGGGTGAAATAVLGADELVPVTTRDWVLFRGYIASFGLSFPNEGVIGGSATVQISGDIEIVPKV